LNLIRANLYFYIGYYGEWNLNTFRCCER